MPTRSASLTGSRSAVAGLVDVPKSLVAKVVFDQSIFVKSAIENLLHEGAIGLILTGLMILVFLGNFRATVAVFLSIPLSALAAFIGLSFGDNSVNAMILGGLALRFLALDRQFRRRPGKHLSPCGKRRRPGRRRRKGRTRSRPSRARGHSYNRCCFLSGDLPIRGQPVSFHGACSVRCAVAFRFLRGGHDCCSAFLREVYSPPRSAGPYGRRSNGRFASARSLFHGEI